MCIACELGLMIAMDDVPDVSPPGFPRARPRDEAARFSCDAPPKDAPPPAEDEPNS